MMRRRGRGLVGMAARTAVVAGTATAVSGAVAGHQQNKANEAYEQQAVRGAAEPGSHGCRRRTGRRERPGGAAPPPPPAAPAGGGSDLMAQLNQLGTLHAQGILSDEEFTAAKAKLLS